MVTRLSKIILISFLTLFISCKNDAQKKNELRPQTKNINQKIDFFDKKYFQGYLMSVDASTPAEHPFFSYLNCEQEGYFSVHFIPKDKQLMYFWKNKYFAENKYEYDDKDTENKIIGRLLNGKNNLYNIFCFQISPKFLDISNGCTEESVNLKKEAFANVFLYNPITKLWDFQKSMKVNILPTFADNKFFTNNFTKYFKESNFPHNTKQTYSYLKNELKHQGYKISFEKSGDINQDGNADKIIVLSKDSEQFPINYSTEVILLDKDENAITIFKNENVITSSTGNSYAEGLMDIVVKNGYFTYEDNTSAGYVNQTFYITFVFNKNDRQIYLHKIGNHTTYPDGGSEKDWDKEYSTKDFGKIKFEEFNIENIQPMLNKK